MPNPRPNPYGNFNFTVQLNDGSDDSPIVGGFSDVSGLGNEVKFSEYRNGSDKENHTRKIPNINSTDDVTLKRGVVGDLRLIAWLKSTREGDIEQRTVVITLRDEKGDPAASFVLTNTLPKKWVGPTLAGKGGGEVAMEELHLVAERIDFNLA